MQRTIEAFKSVGEPTRFRALRILIDAEKELCACEIIDVLLKPQYTISKSLGALVAAGLVEERREGRMMLYNLVHGPLNDNIFAAIGSIDRDEELSGDHERLVTRLALRVEGEGIKGC
jgi:ArsR family transcriptional regulator, arsenate/arsenite/antimonite-responsive transcriptional repressor